MSFDPKEHLTKIQGREYLEAKWREVWFRDRYPEGSIITELIGDSEFRCVRATVSANGVILATGMATVRSGEKQVWLGRDVEKAETAAIGRALAHAGFGTQFTDEDDTDNLADSPVERPHEQSTGITEAQIVEAVAFMYDHPEHAKNSVHKMFETRELQPEMKLNPAISTVLLHCAKSEPYNFDIETLLAALNAANDGVKIISYGEWLKTGHTHQEAWQAIVTYHEMVGSPPATAKENVPF